jgi:hypothetical protein
MHSIGDSGGSPDDQNLDRNTGSIDSAHEFYMEMKTVLGIGVEVIHVLFW